MKRIDKKEARNRWQELTILWNEYDPIGVIEFNTKRSDREYQTYVGETLRLLEQGVTRGELTSYLLRTSVDLGLSDIDRERASRFSERLTNWYSDNWPNTRV